MITSISSQPHWQPLLQHLGAELCAHFMFMASYPLGQGRTVHTYKHHDTRRYLNIDDRGTFYRYTGGTYTPTSPEAALEHAYS